jgi:thioredoxin-related protein
MKPLRILLLLLITIGFNPRAMAQADSIPVYKRFPTVPPFSIMRYPDSTAFAKKDLPGKKPVIVMVFSPDCHHCQAAAKDLLANMELFKKVQVVMATPLAYSYITPFYNEFKLGDHPNITIGWDAGNFLGTFYGVRNYPSIYLYDKKGRFVESFEGDVSFKKIAESL